MDLLLREDPKEIVLDFLLLRDPKSSDTASIFRRRVEATPADAGESAQGNASSWPAADVKTHKIAARTPWKKLTASVLVSETKESVYSSLLNGFEVSNSSFPMTIESSSLPYTSL